jgi:hypothetical protein
VLLQPPVQTPDPSRRAPRRSRTLDVHERSRNATDLRILEVLEQARQTAGLYDDIGIGEHEDIGVRTLDELL